MVEKGKISALQMGIMMYPAILATAILLVPGITTKHAERDMWLSPIWASLTGLFTVYIAVKLHKLFPNETIIEYSRRIIGSIPGMILGFVYILFYLHITSLILREYAEFVAGTLLTLTPLHVVLGSMIAVCAFAVRGGLEVIARASEICVPVVVLLLIFIIILLTPELDPKNMLPVLEHGIMPSIMGSIVPQSWFSEFILLAFFLPFLTDREKGMKFGVLSVLAVMVTMALTNLVTLFVLGNITPNRVYPLMTAASYISIADFLENLESIVMALWVAGTFVKISVFYYVVVLGTAQWLKLSDYRPIVLPIGLLLAAGAVWSAPNLQEMKHFLGTSTPFYLLSVQTVTPLILLVIAVAQKKLREKKEPQQ